MGSAVLRRDHTVLGGGSDKGGDLSGDLAQDSEKGSALSYSIILVEEEAISCKDSFRASVLHWIMLFLKGGDFWRSAIFEKLFGLFWVLLGGEAIPKVS